MNFMNKPNKVWFELLMFDNTPNYGRIYFKFNIKHQVNCSWPLRLNNKYLRHNCRQS